MAISSNSRSQSGYTTTTLLAFALSVWACNPPAEPNHRHIINDKKNESEQTAISQTEEKNGKDQTDSEAAAEPLLVSGVYLADYKNARLRCDFSTKNTDSFVTSCAVVVSQPDGREFKAVQLKDGVEIVWRNPTTLRGEGTIADCKIQNAKLTFVCQVTNGNPAGLLEVQFSLQVTDEKNPPRIESSNVMLPYSVGVAAGLVPLVPFEYHGQREASAEPEGSSPMGFQQLSFVRDQISFSYPAALCLVNNKIFFIHGYGVYVVKDKVVELYAGSSNKENINNLTHRLRTYLEPTYLACGKDHIYVSSESLSRIYSIDDDGGVSVIAGEAGSFDSTEDGHTAAGAVVNSPTGIALSPQGEVVFVETGALKVRAITKEGLLRTLASMPSTAGATDVLFGFPTALAIVPDGTIYISDTRSHAVGKVDKEQKVTLVAGTGTARYQQPPSPSSKSLAEPISLATDKTGALYIGELYRGVIRIAADGRWSLPASAGTDITESAQDMSPSRWEEVARGRPSYRALAVGDDGTIFTDTPTGIQQFLPGEATPRRLVGLDKEPTDCDKPLNAESAHFIEASALSYDKDDSLIVADWQDQSKNNIIVSSIYQENGKSHTSAIAGCKGEPELTGDSVSHLALSLAGITKNRIGSLSSASDGTLFMTNTYQNKVLQINAQGVVKVFAGNGDAVSSGDGGPALSAGLNRPHGIALDSDGNLLVAEAQKIRKILPNGTITSVPIVSVRDEAALVPYSPTSTKLDARAIATSKDGRIFISDYTNKKIRMLDKTGLLQTIAGGGSQNAANEGIDARLVRLSYPENIAVTNDDTIYFIESGSSHIRELRKHSDGSWLIYDFFGRNVGADCASGRKSSFTTEANAAGEIKNSLAIICAGSLRTLTVKDTCPEKDGKTKIAFAQSFVDYANIVEVVKPCVKVH